jgi:hypothetical protein
MKTAIEKSLARLAGKVEAIEARLDALQKASPSMSAFSAGSAERLCDVIAAATQDNRASVASRLRALHGGGSGESQQATPRNSFGKPSVSRIIDGEFTEVKGE